MVMGIELNFESAAIGISASGFGSIGDHSGLLSLSFADSEDNDPQIGLMFCCPPSPRGLDQ